MNKWGIIGLFVLASGFAAIQCNSSSATEDAGDQTGSLGHACYGNGTCNPGLTCSAQICVETSDADVTDASTDSEPQPDSAITDAATDVSDAVVYDAFNFGCIPINECDKNGVCCAQLSGTGAAPSCSFQGGVSACQTAASCPTTISLTTCSPEVRLCALNTDCQEPLFGQCCGVPTADGGRISFCMNLNYATFYGGTCP